MKILRRSLPIFFAASVLATISSCSGNGVKVTKEDLTAARDSGRKRAIELAEKTGLDTLTMEMKLLDIREREHRLRLQGLNQVADAYIESFLSTLDSVNPSLSETIRE